MDKSYIQNIFDGRSGVIAISHDILQELHTLKEELHDVSAENKLNLNPLFAINEEYISRAAALKGNITSSTDFMEINNELESCIQEILKLRNAFEENNVLLSKLDIIEAFSNSLGNTASFLRDKNYFESCKSLLFCQRNLNEAMALSRLDFFKNLKLETFALREELLSEMNDVWSNTVVTSIDRTSDGRFVSIEVDTSKFADVQDIIRALYLIKDENALLKFFTTVKENVMVPLTLHECTVLMEKNDCKAVIKIIIHEENKPKHYNQVFDNIITVVDFLKAHLNVIVDDNKHFIQLLGASMVHDLSLNCLVDAIPHHPGQSGSFSKIVEDAEKFQHRLQKVGFLPENLNSLIEGQEQKNFFANTMFLSYLDRARTIVKKDLHNTVRCPEIAPPDWSAFPGPVTQEIKLIFNFSSDTSVYQGFLISKSAEEVLELVDALLEELKQNNPDRALKLLYTIRNIFEIYAAIVPIHHQKLLNSLPQQVAILHNNCLYYAYRLLTLACECRGWSADLRSHYHVFLDEAVSLRQLAAKCLEDCVSNQRSSLIANLYNSGLETLRENGKLADTAERSVRQCVRQLELLRNVWIEMLADHVYINTMGFLIDEFTQAIVSVLTNTEDISAKDANELIKIFAIIEDRLPKLFNEPKAVYRLCKKWDRFQNLIFILGNNLDKISERWAAGLGPLAHSFTKAEVQGLVRALFQNTERRSILLSQIYNS